MAAKEIIFSQPARQAIAQGLNILANTVKATLGPRGRNVIIEKSWGSPLVTKDGVTVAKEIELTDKVQNMGAKLVKEAASKTSDKAGDGTTLTLVLDGTGQPQASGFPIWQAPTGVETYPPQDEWTRVWKDGTLWTRLTRRIVLVPRHAGQVALDSVRFSWFDPSTGRVSGQVTVDARSGQSGNSSRDGRMHREILETQRYPEIAFRPDRMDGAIAPGDNLPGRR